MKLWSKKQINDWFRKQPYYVGANFIPSTAINQLEMWQKETFDPVTIRRELGYAGKIGMNIMRVYLHDLLWEQDRKGFAGRIDQYLAIADSFNIKTMFVLFDDCWNPNFSLGRQPEPVPFAHNSGWVQSPGMQLVNDSAKWPRLQQYVTELLEHYKDDERIVVWDLYNEPGNGTSGDDSAEKTKQRARSLPFLEAVFGWARQVDGLSQPVTTGVWNFSDQFSELNKFALTNSDIITFHSYNPPLQLLDRISDLMLCGRPMICTEYMARGSGSTFEFCLPLLKKYNVGAINWGLVSGKTQTIYPWCWNKAKGEPDIFFHDIFHPDGTFLWPSEELAIKQITEADKSI